MTELRPGTIGFSTIGGSVGWLVRLGQFVIADDCRYSHVFVVLDGNQVLEAMPRGARFRQLTTEDIAASSFWEFPLTERERSWLMFEASMLEGTKYGFSAYLNLALIRLGLRSRRLERYLKSNRRLICSQLADWLLHKAGYQVFNDGRLPHEVSPGDLWYAAVEQAERVKIQH